MSNKNRVKFGLKRCYYAKATIADDGSATYDTPKPIKGARTLSMDPSGDNEPFYADDIVYYMAGAGGARNGSLEVALIPDDFKKDILGYFEDADGVLVEPANPAVVNFALLFEFSGDAHGIRHVLYNCMAGAVSVSGSTKEATNTPQPESISLSSTSVYNAALQKDVSKAECGPDKATKYNAWYEDVHQSTGMPAGGNQSSGTPAGGN